MKYKSKFEQSFADDLKRREINFKYEPVKFPYILEKNYIPDFILEGYDFIIETKVYFTPADRAKLLAVRKMNPKVDIRLVFMNPYTKINSKSKTRYSDWCDKNGFKWANKNIPQAWLKERK